MVKNYEDTAVKILNLLSLSKIQHPPQADDFGIMYKKTNQHRRTIFIDLDDTLTYISLFKLDSSPHKQIQISESGSTMKVIY
jgi:hypothetical protein